MPKEITLQYCTFLRLPVTLTPLRSDLPTLKSTDVMPPSSLKATWVEANPITHKLLKVQSKTQSNTGRMYLQLYLEIFLKLIIRKICNSTFASDGDAGNTKVGREHECMSMQKIIVNGISLLPYLGCWPSPTHDTNIM